MELSLRLKTLANMVTEGYTVGDIGCDHGYVSIYLVKSGRCPRAIAMDVKKGPLGAARKHIEEYGVTQYIDTRLSDGLENLNPSEVDCIICAGMGGRLMARILEQGKEVVSSLKEMILQPQSELDFFRKYVIQSGYLIVAEDMVYEDGKYYPMMKVLVSGCVQNRLYNPYDQAVNSDGNYESMDAYIPMKLAYLYGGLLLKNRNAVLKQFLQEQIRKQKEIMEKLENHSDPQRLEERKQQIIEKQESLVQALALYGKEGKENDM